MRGITTRVMLLVGLAAGMPACFNYPDWSTKKAPATVEPDIVTEDDIGLFDLGTYKPDVPAKPDVVVDTAQEDFLDTLDTFEAGPVCLAAPATMAIDGAFTGWPGDKHEWDCAFPIEGLYSRLWIRFDKGRLHLLNDWIVRDDGDICPAMYNQFYLSTGGGKQQWDVKVYGDGKAVVQLNGQPYPLIEAAYGYNPSPSHAKPHTIFEFLLGADPVTNPAGAVLEGPILVAEKDPNTATALKTPLSGEVPGCDDPEGALLTEPNVFVAVLESGKPVQGQTSSEPILVWASPLQAKRGQTVQVIGGLLGETKGKLLLGGLEVTPFQWSANDIRFKVPQTAALGPTTLQAQATTGTTNALQLDILASDDDCTTKASGAPCDDGLACTKDDVCGDGGCQGTLACDFAADGVSAGCATPKACLPNQTCTYATAGTVACDDANACTTQDTCYFGKCTGIKVDVKDLCSDGVDCTVDTCDSKKGCQHVELAKFSPCDDGNACTKNELCSASLQCLGEKIQCDDGNVCTQDGCSALTGCTATPTPANPACDDKDACTSQDKCVGGKCVGTAVSCDDGKPCTTDACTPSGCKHDPVLDGLTCNDGNPCTLGEKCDTTGKCAGPPTGCDDGNPCTQDSCDPKTGCVHTKTC